MDHSDSMTLIIDIVIIISASFLFGIFAHKLKQSVIIAYIFVGILVGPHGLGLINMVGEVNSLAEIGVALLMFVIGVEFKFSHVGRIWKIIIFGGIFQITFVMASVYAISISIGYTTFSAVILGMVGAISSTMLVVKILTEKREMNLLHSRIMVGLLIIQDLAVVIMVFFIINFEQIAKGNTLDFLKVLGISIAAVAAIVIIGRKLLPKVMYLIVKMKSKEMFLLSIFSFSIGISVTTHLLGLSISLGAFIVGFMLSEAEYNREISAQIRPLKDIFIVIFFVSVGLFIDPKIILNDIPMVFFIVTIMMFGKFIACALPTWVFGYDGKTAVKVGMGMMQIGEFSFVMLTMGKQHGYLSSSLFSSTTAAALISIMLTPLAINQADRVHRFFTKSLPLGKLLRHIPHYKLANKKENKDKLEGHVIICGFGRSGSTVAKALDKTYDVVIIDHDIQKLEKIKQLNYKYQYGDAINHHLLIKASIATAQILILTIPDINAKSIATRYAKVYNPEIEVIARGRSEAEKGELQQIGVDHVIIPQTLEAVEIIGKVMT